MEHEFGGSQKGNPDFIQVNNPDLNYRSLDFFLMWGWDPLYCCLSKQTHPQQKYSPKPYTHEPADFNLT